MPGSAASDLGLYCLPMSQRKDARLIWANEYIYKYQFLKMNNFNHISFKWGSMKGMIPYWLLINPQ